MIDYKGIGFKAGLEVHQQLEGRKLFCHCPTIHSEREDFVIERELRVSASETGKIDVAAAFELAKGKRFVYHGSYDSCCLVELDEEPPHSINEVALDTALMISMLLKAKITQELHVMRKIVIDGSNVAGFQRTMLIARNGMLDTSSGPVRINSICLEEEAAQKIKEDNEKVEYSLDRLGIPLIEIATEADIKNAEHAKEVAALLGMILRSTERVKRGLGTIRQDINVSVKNGPKVELKGFQDLRSITKVIEKEVERQSKLFEVGKLVSEVRKVEDDFSTTFVRPMPGAERMYPETDIEPIRVTDMMLKIIKTPELISEKSLRLESSYGLKTELASELIKEKIDFESFVKRFKNIEPEFLARTLVETPKDIKKRYKLNMPRKLIEEILSYLNEGKITKSAVEELLINSSRTGKIEKIDIIQFRPVSDKELEQIIKSVIERNKGAPLNALMGEAMKELRGRVDGKRVMELIKKFSL